MAVRPKKRPKNLGKKKISDIDSAVIEALNFGRPSGVAYYDAEGNLRMPEQDGVPMHEMPDGSMMADDDPSMRGMARGGKVKAKGMARGGKVMAKGMARGGKVMAKGMARGGKVKAKGMARGGKVMAKGMAKGGKVMSKGYAKGGKVMPKGMANGGRIMSKGTANGGLMRRSDSRDRSPGSRTF